MLGCIPAFALSLLTGCKGLFHVIVWAAECIIYSICYCTSLIYGPCQITISKYIMFSVSVKALSTIEFHSKLLQSFIDQIHFQKAKARFL